MKKALLRLIVSLDFLLVLFVFPAALLLKLVRRTGVQRLPLCKKALFLIGVFPVRNHYYEPQFDMTGLKTELSADRDLQGINLNIEGQLNFLQCLTYSGEMNGFPTEKSPERRYYFNNSSFTTGDAEYWYQVIRHFKPRRIIEIGSGNSTLMAIEATRKNSASEPLYRCDITCIEPYEMPWLEEVGVKVIRKKVEDVELSFFAQLQRNDVLFIDSSHVIRPQGDVVYEILQILPSLSVGVIVHVHDIFTPRNYRKDWLLDEVRLWNEQYMLEAFLCQNDNWEVLGALNYLHHNHFERFKEVAPFSRKQVEPGSFYLRRIR